MKDVIKTYRTKDDCYKSSYSVWIIFSDGYLQHTTRYTDAYPTVEEAIKAAVDMPKEISIPETSKEVARTKKTLKLYSSKKYVYSIKYINYGADLRFKKKFTINKYHLSGKTVSKTMYTPWLHSFKECDEYADEIRRHNGVFPDNDRLEAFPNAHSKQVKPFSLPK